MSRILSLMCAEEIIERTEKLMAKIEAIMAAEKVLARTMPR